VGAGGEWTSIPGGSFQMGSTNASDEQPVHQVDVPAFEMRKTEVTVAQYSACVQASACSAPGIVSDCNWGVSGKESHPLNCVDWEQAVAFCAWAGGRLPSEAEWEYAARGGGQSITYPWGEQAPSCTYAVIWEGGDGCGTNSTWVVCSKTAGNTVQGLCDMAGNVWEWVQDWYHSNYTGAPWDGSAWEAPAGSFRVLRGGHWKYSLTGDARASSRGVRGPGAIGAEMPVLSRGSDLDGDEEVKRERSMRRFSLWLEVLACNDQISIWTAPRRIPPPDRCALIGSAASWCLRRRGFTDEPGSAGWRGREGNAEKISWMKGVGGNLSPSFSSAPFVGHRALKSAADDPDSLAWVGGVAQGEFLVPADLLAQVEDQALR